MLYHNSKISSSPFQVTWQIKKLLMEKLSYFLGFFVVGNYTGVNDNFIFLSLVSVAVAGLITISANYVLRSFKLQ